jgi:hypothetical protein
MRGGSSTRVFRLRGRRARVGLSARAVMPAIVVVPSGDGVSEEGAQQLLKTSDEQRALGPHDHLECSHGSEPSEPRWLRECWKTQARDQPRQGLLRPQDIWRTRLVWRFRREKRGDTDTAIAGAASGQSSRLWTLVEAHQAVAFLGWGLRWISG